MDCAPSFGIRRRGGAGRRQIAAPARRGRGDLWPQRGGAMGW